MGRPSTGQTRVMGFRPPKPLRDEFEALAAAEERTPSDALIEAMHDWIRKKRHEREAAQAREQGDRVQQAAEAFAAELIRLRTDRGLSQPALARRMGYDKSYVTHVERCIQAPTEQLARQADHVLGSGQALNSLWRAYRTARDAEQRDPHPASSSALPGPASAGSPGGSDPTAAARDTPHAPGGRTVTSTAPDTDRDRQ